MVSLGTQPANRKSGFGHSSPTGARAQDLSRQPARPDLWGARVSNDPGLPDRVRLPCVSVMVDIVFPFRKMSTKLDQAQGAPLQLQPVS